MNVDKYFDCFGIDLDVVADSVRTKEGRAEVRAVIAYCRKWMIPGQVIADKEAFPLLADSVDIAEAIVNDIN